MLVIILFCASFVTAATIQLPRGTEVKAKFSPGMQIKSGQVEKDIPLLFTLAEPITIGSKTLVEAGAQGTAKVTEVEKAGMIGKPGYIKIEFIDLEVKGAYKLLQGDKIKLEGEIENKGKGKKILSIILGFGLIIKGGQGEIDTGQTYTAKVAETVILEGE
jgi:hypothetical protein